MMMEAIIKQEVIEKEPREVILTWKEKPKEQNVSKYDPKPKLGPFSIFFLPILLTQAIFLLF